MENLDKVQKPVSWDLEILNNLVKFRKEKGLNFSDAANHCCKEGLKTLGFKFDGTKEKKDAD